MRDALRWITARLSALAAVVMMVHPALAADGQPSDWQFGFQPPATPIMEQIEDFHTLVLVLITVIMVFVLGLLLVCIFRFNEKRHPTPTRTSHNTALEVAWTVVPILILLVIAVPSFRLLYAQYDFPKADVTIKAIGSQWFWSYEYPKEDDLYFDSILSEGDDLKPGQPRLLTVDNPVVVPVNKNVQVLVTSNDVIHDWAMPAFGIKTDAVAGRVTRTWFRATRTGTFHGECSELCGARHAFMPIVVKVVSQKDYEAWLKKAKEEFASNVPPRDKGGDGGTAVAGLDR